MEIGKADTDTVGVEAATVVVVKATFTEAVPVLLCVISCADIGVDVLT